MNPEILDFFRLQLTEWPLAGDNYSALGRVCKKPFSAGNLNGFVQYNPGRAVSTLAKVDKKDIEKRKCFLCGHNRPTEQKALEILPGWDLLVNPFPILPYHFTIAGRDHVSQKLSIETGKALSRKLPGMVVFFNDDGAGASAPDHVHFQAVPKSELPLINILEKTGEAHIKDLNLPFLLLEREEDIEANPHPANTFFLIDDSGEERIFSIPRRSHRPHCYFQEGKERRVVSPGSIDMAGIIVTPFEEDFHALTDEEIEKIYREVGFPAKGRR